MKENTVNTSAPCGCHTKMAKIHDDSALGLLWSWKTQKNLPYVFGGWFPDSKAVSRFQGRFPDSTGQAEAH
jgi:hypothetical protein